MIRFSIRLFAITLSVVYASDEFYYSGLTDDGWKIFKYGETKPISYIGDCRRPSLFEKTLYFKDSQGRVVLNQVGDKESSLLKGTQKICDYVVTPEGLYFTRLLTNEPTRQALWLLEEGEPRLIYRFDEGSIRQLTYASGVLVFSKILGTYEEVIYKLSSNEPIRLTEANHFCVSPSLNQAGTKMLFSKRMGKDNFDIFLLNLESKEERQLTQTATATELSPSFSSDGMSIYFERRDEDLNQQIINFDLETQEEHLLTLPHPALEPWVVTNVTKKEVDE